MFWNQPYVLVGRTVANEESNTTVVTAEPAENHPGALAPVFSSYTVPSPLLKFL